MRPEGSAYDSPTREGGVKQKSTLSPTRGGLWPQQIKPTQRVLSNAMSNAKHVLLRIHESGPQAAPSGAQIHVPLYPTLTGGAIIRRPFGP